MQKTLKFFGLVVMALMFSGCGQKTVVQQQAVQGQPTTQTGQKDNSIVSSIKDAMNTGKQMKCSYSTIISGGTLESVVYIDGKKFKSISIVSNNKTIMLFDGETMHNWIDGQTTGMKMTMSCINEMQTSVPQGQTGSSGVQSPNDQFDNVTGVNCVAATDADFSVPVNINFTDQCELLKKTLETTKNINDKIPTNMPNIPNLPQ